MGMLHEIKGKESYITEKSQSLLYSPSLLFYPGCSPQPPFPLHILYWLKYISCIPSTTIPVYYKVYSFHYYTCCCPYFFCISLCFFCWIIWSCTYNSEFRLKRFILILQCKPSSYMFNSHTKLTILNPHIIIGIGNHKILSALWNKWARVNFFKE